MMGKLRPKAASYNVVEFLGEGLNSIVYRAVRSDPHMHLQQVVALKILKSENAVELWKREFSNLGKISSKHCVRLFGFEWVNDRPALVLEYVRGVSLRQLCLSGPIPKSLAVEILAQIQCGLNALDEYGMCHGDLSPNNVMIDKTGCVKLVDFGWAKGQGWPLQATPEFCAPEVLQGKSPSRWSDLYSLGKLERLLIQAESTRLNGVPETRRDFESKPDPKAQTELGQRVSDVLDHHDRFRGLTTRSLLLVRQTPAYARGIFMGLMIAVIAPNSAAFAPSVAYLQVRGIKWLKVRVDGESLGYAPLDIAVTAHRIHQIVLEDIDGQKTIRLRLNSGEVRALGDTFPR